MRYRKGELTFYKGMSPQELQKYIKKFPKNKTYVQDFEQNYKYNYVLKRWRKMK